MTSGLHLAKRLSRPRSIHVDETALRELDIYAENTGELYNQKKAILANVRRKLKSGKYDPTKAPKLWAYWVEAAAKRYAREYGGTWNHIFEKATRDKLALELAMRYATGEE